jgi:hypothetical protein
MPNVRLRVQDRLVIEREASPSATNLDSQFVKTTKNGKGRKCQLLVDTLGLVWEIIVTEVDMTDRDSTIVHRHMPRLHRIWANGGYCGAFIDTVKCLSG